jgi:hypothetical protein
MELNLEDAIQNVRSSPAKYYYTYPRSEFDTTSEIVASEFMKANKIAIDFVKECIKDKDYVEKNHLKMFAISVLDRVATHGDELTQTAKTELNMAVDALSIHSNTTDIISKIKGTSDIMKSAALWLKRY